MLKWILVAASALVFSGCLMTRNDVREAEQKRVMQDQVIHLQKNNADSSSRFQEVEAQLRDLNGRVERMEGQSERDANQQDKSRKSQDEVIQEQGKTLNLLKEEMIRMQAQVAGMAAQLEAMSKAPKKADDDAKAEAGKTPYDIGEDLFAKKDWKKAILSYQKYRDAHPKGRRFADATYKIGVCFQELGLNAEARSFYEEVLAKFPNSDTAKKAKVRIKKVK